MRKAIVGLTTGILLVASSLAAHAAWTAQATALHASGKYGTWAACTAGNTTTVVASADGFQGVNGQTLVPSVTDFTGIRMDVEGITSNGSNNNRRSFVQFSTALALIPNGCHIVGAILTMKPVATVSAVETIQIQAVSAAWTEAAPPAWGAAVTGTTVSFNTAGTLTNVFTVDVSALFTQAGGAPRGFRLLTLDNSNTAIAWGTRENGATNARPYIQLWYQ